MWRAGVDQATTLTTESDILIGGKRVPAGKYTLYLHAPTSGTYELLVNRTSACRSRRIYAAAPAAVADAMWPHIEDYPTIKDKEVARVPLKSAPAHEGAADRFLIGLTPAKDGVSGDHAELGRPELDDGRPRRGQVAATQDALRRDEEGGADAAPPFLSLPRAGRAAPLLAVAALLALGLALQLYFFRHYPQPPLFGDPAGYHNVGLRFQEAAARLRAGEPLAPVFASVRGLFYLAGVGALFGVLDALRPGDPAFLRDVMAFANTAAMFGVFVLARRLSGSFAGGLTALALAASYATFSVQTGRLYPDPLTAALLVWAGAAYAGAALLRSRRRMAVAGGLLGLALLLRAQVLEYIVAVLALSLLATARWWWRTPGSRALVAAFLIGLAPALVAWAGIRWAVGARDDVVRMGQVTFRPTYPFGFWQQLETDGWTGPYRFKQDPFYKAMEAEARAGDADLLRSRRKQFAFTLRYVAARPVASLLLVLDNTYRLYDRPANDYKWDYPYSYDLQVFVQRAVVVLGVAGAALLVAEQPVLAGVFLIPVALAVLHGLVFPWPRYNVPAMPFLIASAGVFLVRAAGEAPWRAPRARRFLLTVAVPAMVTLALAELVQDRLPEAARVGRVLGILLVVALPFVVVAIKGRRARRVATAAGAALGVLVVAHAVRDRRWHETSTRLGGDVAAVEQVVRLSPEALGRLRSAPEAFVLFDLTVPRGDLQDAAIEVGARRWPGGAILPTMPRLRESTATGGRDRRGYPQWWALRLDPAALPANAGRAPADPPVRPGRDRSRPARRSLHRTGP